MLHKHARFATLVLIAIAATCCQSLAQAEGPLKGIQTKFRLAGIDVQAYYCIFGSDDSASSGVIVEAARVGAGDWRVSNGTFTIKQIDADSEQLTIRWSSGSTEVGVYKNGQYRISQHSGDERQVGLTMTWSVREVPAFLINSIVAAATERPVLSRALIGSDEWMLEQKMLQMQIKNSWEITKGYLDILD